jgi:hypothetical protein
MAGARCEFLVTGDLVPPGRPEWIRCTRPATQTHHLMRRSHKVDHSTDNLRALCGYHHSYIHANVAWAKENGWILTMWRKMG